MKEENKIVRFFRGVSRLFLNQFYLTIIVIMLEIGACATLGILYGHIDPLGWMFGLAFVGLLAACKNFWHYKTGCSANIFWDGLRDKLKQEGNLEDYKPIRGKYGMIALSISTLFMTVGILMLLIL